MKLVLPIFMFILRFVLNLLEKLGFRQTRFVLAQMKK